MAKDNNLVAPQFQNPEKAREYLESQVWPLGPVCPHCGSLSKDHYRLEGKTSRPGLYKCKDCREPFTVTVGTVFERSKIPLNKWLMATYLLCSSKKGMSAHQLHRTIGVTYKTAWFMTHRIREAMTNRPNGLLGSGGGTVEVDETFWGNKKAYGKGPKGFHHKMKVFSLVDRNGEARSFHIPNVNSATLKPILMAQIAKDAHVITDDANVYKKAAKGFASHKSVNHSIGEYSRIDGTHTNTVEGYFSLLKRGLIGTFHHVGEQHLQRYVKEFDFRWTHRVGLGYSDVDRYRVALKGIKGKRLTYRRIDETTRNLEGNSN
jgi:transposase-like protein